MKIRLGKRPRLSCRIPLPESISETGRSDDSRSRRPARPQEGLADGARLRVQPLAAGEEQQREQDDRQRRNRKIRFSGWVTAR